jgi:hypothetical protein
MNFTGIDLHTKRFTCCYRDERRSDNPKDKVVKTFDLTAEGMAAFYATLTADTYILVEATNTIFSFVRRFKDRVKEVIIGNTCRLKQISLARNNTDKIDSCLAVPGAQGPGAFRGTTDSPGDSAAGGDHGRFPIIRCRVFKQRAAGAGRDGQGSPQGTGIGGCRTLYGPDRDTDQYEEGERAHRRSDYRGQY